MARPVITNSTRFRTFAMQPRQPAGSCHSAYTLWLNNHDKQRQQNSALLSMRSQAHVRRHNTLLPRPSSTRVSLCTGAQRGADTADAACNEENHSRQRGMADAESSLWIRPPHSSCRR